MFFFIMLKRIALLLAFASFCKSGDSGRRQVSDENCETLNSEVHIMKDEYDENGRMVRTCSGDVLVTKCEGYCDSQVQPSVITSTGFLKECYCCRESYLKERIVLLDRCYNGDGQKLGDKKLSSMDIKLREPAECKCSKCGEFSR